MQMNKEQHKQPIRDAVLEKIHKGQARMRPKWHFILKTVLLFIGLVIVLLAFLYLASFTIFILHQTGVWFLPIFGLRGIRAFLFSLPWFLILLGIVFTVVLELLVRHYSFAYRKPFLYSLAVIIVFITITSFAISKTALHQNFSARAKGERLPFAGKLYRDYGSMKNNPDVHPGMIIEITAEGFLMDHMRDGTTTVIVVLETRFPLGMDFEKGDRVVVLGERKNETIQAFGIRRIDENEKRPSRFHRGWRPSISAPMYR